MSDISFETEQKLKSYLNTHQKDRERMCLKILSLDKNYTQVQPRHPNGGPDKGRDIQAIYKDELICFVAVGFVNNASDSKEQKKEIIKKFDSDLESAIKNASEEKIDLKGFVFFTNISLTNGEKNRLKNKATKKSIEHCEIFCRENLLIALTSPEGYAIRFDFLNIPLTPAEQSVFFSKWGNDIQSIISTGFQYQKKAVNRMVFLQESTLPISYGFFLIKFNKSYKAEELNHFRIICNIIFPDTINLNDETAITGFSCLYTDNSDRFNEAENTKTLSGIKYGHSTATILNTVELIKNDDTDKEDDIKFSHMFRTKGHGVGFDELSKISLNFTDQSLYRIAPIFKINDFEDAKFTMMISENLKDKIESIEMYARGYRLFHIDRNDLRFTPPNKEYFDDYPIKFTNDELKTKWLAISVNYGTFYEIDFVSKTPLRMIEYE